MAPGLSACCLLLLLAGFVAPVPGFLKEGSPCWDAVSATFGTCLKARHCQGALAAIRDYRPLPSHCGFVGFDEIVCCTDGHNDGTPQHDDNPPNPHEDVSWPDNIRGDDIWAGLGDKWPAAEGAPCWDSASASTGSCRPPLHCQRALGRPPPSRCRFVGPYEMVCCTDGHDDSQRGGSHPDHDGGGHSDDRDLFEDSDIWVGLGPSVAACRRYKYEIIATPPLLSGSPADQLELPHMAAIGYKLPGTKGISWKCGGTLISDQFVLTAAHCCTKRPVQVRLGAVDLTSPGDEYDQYGISEIIVHPSYRRRQYHSDIALLKLDRRVVFGQSVFPACLNTQHSDPPSFTAAGWGATNPIGTRKSSSLMKSTIYPFQLSDCQNSYKERFPKENSSSVICAGDPEGKTDTCGGDSGGPLVVGKAAPYTVVGITSKGLRPCGGNMPAIYTRVSDYIDWIEDHVWPSDD